MHFLPNLQNLQGNKKKDLLIIYYLNLYLEKRSKPKAFNSWAGKRAPFRYNLLKILFKSKSYLFSSWAGKRSSKADTV